MERALSKLQEDVLAKLRKRGCVFIAAVTEEHWQRGETYYIDTRVPLPKPLRANFNRGNREAANA
jgi:hypothetical protein